MSGLHWMSLYLWHFHGYPFERGVLALLQESNCKLSASPSIPILADAPDS